jgi:membrane carboxypeptidase/penicillin-binding protein
MSDMLRAVVTEGTAAAAFRDDNPPDAHAKTGTTQDHKDVWLDGYTPKMVCIVWAGHPSKDAHGNNIYGLPMHEGAWGATISAPIWKRFMIGALAIQAKEEAREHPKPKPALVATPAAATDASATDVSVTAQQVPDHPRKPSRRLHADADDGGISADGQNVTIWIDDTTGLRTHANAPGAHQETFARGTEPTDDAPAPSDAPAAPTDSGTATPHTDTLTPPSVPTPAPVVHAAAPPPPAPIAPRMVTVSICIESGKRATEWCPETIDKQFPADAVPGYCRIHKPPPGEH